MSVLFADVVGFTGRSERLDVEDVQGFLGYAHLDMPTCAMRCGSSPSAGQGVDDQMQNDSVRFLP